MRTFLPRFTSTGSGSRVPRRWPSGPTTKGSRRTPRLQCRDGTSDLPADTASRGRPGPMARPPRRCGGEARRRQRRDLLGRRPSSRHVQGWTGRHGRSERVRQRTDGRRRSPRLDRTTRQGRTYRISSAGRHVVAKGQDLQHRARLTVTKRCSTTVHVEGIHPSWPRPHGVCGRLGPPGHPTTTRRLLEVQIQTNSRSSRTRPCPTRPARRSPVETGTVGSGP